MMMMIMMIMMMMMTMTMTMCRQVVGISMGTHCAPLVPDLFLFCYERDFMTSLSDDKQTDKALNKVTWSILIGFIKNESNAFMCVHVHIQRVS